MTGLGASVSSLGLEERLFCFKTNFRMNRMSGIVSTKTRIITMGTHGTDLFLGVGVSVELDEGIVEVVAEEVWLFQPEIEPAVELVALCQ